MLKLKREVVLAKIRIRHTKVYITHLLFPPPKQKQKKNKNKKKQGPPPQHCTAYQGPCTMKYSCI